MAELTAEGDDRSRARARRMRAAVATSALSKVSSVAYLIVAVPLIVASVGSNGYSQFAVVIAAFGWVNPLFVGLGSAVTERVASDDARSVSDDARGTFMTALCMTGVLLGIFGLGGALVLLSRPPGEDHTALTIAGIATGLAVGGGVFDSALLGLQRSYISNLLGFGSSFVAIGATLVVAVAAPTVGGMVLATLGPAVLAAGISALALRRIAPGLWGRIADIAWPMAPRIAVRGFVFACFSFASYLSRDAGLLVVAGRLGTTEVAQVALVFRVLPMVLAISGMITVPLWPAIAEAARHGDAHWIARIGGRATALVMGYAVAAGLAIVVVGDKAVSLWTGGRIIEPQVTLVAAAGLIVLTCSEAVTSTMLFGLGQAGRAAAVLSVRGLLSVVLVFLLVGPFGQLAALLGSILAALLTTTWLLPLLVVQAVRSAHDNLGHLS